jgi:hypothetical protein
LPAASSTHARCSAACLRTTPQEHPKLMEAALASLKGAKSGLAAEAWLEAGLVEAIAAYMGEAAAAQQLHGACAAVEHMVPALQ